MRTYVLKQKKELENSGLIPIFEIAVLNKETLEIDYIIFNIEIVGNSLKVTFAALTKKQQKSKKIAFFKFEIDKDSTLKQNLEFAYSEAINCILYSDFFILAD